MNGSGDRVKIIEAVKTSEARILDELSLIKGLVGSIGSPKKNKKRVYDSERKLRNSIENALSSQTPRLDEDVESVTKNLVKDIKSKVDHKEGVSPVNDEILQRLEATEEIQELILKKLDMVLNKLIGIEQYVDDK